MISANLVDYDQVTRGYETGLNTQLRGFRGGARFLEHWVHDPDSVKSIVNMIEAAETNGLADVTVVLGVRTHSALDMVRLSGLGGRRPNQLSGGQRQRVALARAVVNEPEVLLLDEPLGALDLKLRQEMQIELKQIQKEVGITFVYVTHDQEEALTMSDRVAVMSSGRIQQIGTPVEVYEQPATEFVADFIGISNILLRDGVRFVVRPEKIRMLAEGEPADVGMTVEPGRVEQVIYAGMTTRYIVHLDRGEQLVAVRQNMDAQDDAQKFEGQPVRLAWTADHTYVLNK